MALYNMFIIIIGSLLFTLSVEAYDTSEDINKFLFGNQNFEFVDLTQTTNRDAEKDAFTEDYRCGTKNKKESCDLPMWFPSQEKEVYYAKIMGNLSHTCLNERLGTNINVMSGYVTFKKEIIIRDLPLKNLILPLIIADISDKVNGNGNFVLHKFHLDYFLNNYFGKTYQPCLIVFKFGWSKYYNDRKKYCGFEENNQTSFYPGMSEEVAKWITTAYKNVVGVGVDLPALDPASSTTFPAFETLVDAGVYVITNVNLNQYIPEAHCTALVLPPKIVGLGSSPLRLTAVCPKSRMQKPSHVLEP